MCVCFTFRIYIYSTFLPVTPAPLSLRPPAAIASCFSVFVVAAFVVDGFLSQYVWFSLWNRRCVVVVAVVAAADAVDDMVPVSLSSTVAAVAVIMLMLLSLATTVAEAAAAAVERQK